MATSKVLCRYYISNCCTKGASCSFSHDMKDNPDQMCRYYIKGSCVYGNSCRYIHRKPPTSTQRPSPLINKLSETLPKIPGPVSLAAAAGIDVSSDGMVILTKDPTRKPSEWVKAPEFVPGSTYHGASKGNSPPEEELRWGDEEEEEEYFFSYSQVAMLGLPSESVVMDDITLEEASNLLCPFYEMTGNCPWNENCEYTHGLECDMCFKHCLHPNDLNQQKEHKIQCVKKHEEEMERAFAVQRSEGRVCGICMEVVLAKPCRSDRRFGILSNCDHCFCLNCIRKWRQSTHTSKKVIRACPMCRVISYIVIPSEVWISDENEKTLLLEGYKGNLVSKACKYFNEGKGTCPFGDSCLYKHAFPDGSLSKSVPRLTLDGEGLSKPVSTNTLWDFLEEREERVWSSPPLEEL